MCHDVDTARPLDGSDHPPVAGGECASCHHPHASDVAAFLQAPSMALCTSCHVEIGERLENENAHMPALDDCMTCHTPHVARQPKLLHQELRAGARYFFRVRPSVMGNPRNQPGKEGRVRRTVLVYPWDEELSPEERSFFEPLQYFSA